MSKLLVTSFFPAHCVVIFEAWLPGLYDILYPQDVEEKCPEQTMTDMVGLGITIRRPFLAVFALFGISIGLLGALRIQYALAATRRRTNTKASVLHEPTFYWMWSFLFFGLMNFSGLFLHCLLPTTEISPLERPFFWIGDSFTTGAFGTSLWAAAVMESLPSMGVVPKKTIHNVIPTGWAFGNLMGLGAIAWFLIFGYDADATIPGTLPLEMWYFGPPVFFASVALILMLFREFSWMLCFAFALSYFVFCVGAFDMVLCRKFGTIFLDLLTTPTLMFLATDLVYLGIALWLEQRHLEQRQKAKQI